MLVLGGESRFLAVGEQRPDLDSLGTGCLRGAQSLGSSRATRNPERSAQFHHLGEVDFIARAVERLAGLAQTQLTPRRCVVTTRSRALDDEAVDMAARL